MNHSFQGHWISNAALSALQPRNVFYRQLNRPRLDCSEHRNQHILFRKTFSLTKKPSCARLFITADDYYKLYVNGRFVTQGPAPSYHFRYHYNEIDLSEYLTLGQNTLAVHTYYQGLVNRVWQSGDGRHGLLCDLVIDGETAVCSDESFRVAQHTGFTELGVTGKHQTQFLERYDARSAEVGFEHPDFDDRAWEYAQICRFADYTLLPQPTKFLVFETVHPQRVTQNNNTLRFDFGANYVGYLRATATGRAGDLLFVRHGQELEADGSLRFDMRANCKYEEEWILSDGACELEQFDYRVFRYAELEIPEGVQIGAVTLCARHYPFQLQTALKPNYAADPDLQKIWELCVRTQQYGVQEVIQDCMDREKGFYLGDGCYTALTHMVLTNDDSMMRKLIDDAFSTDCITDTLMTCMDCSFMQEIAEYPLILVYSVLWHYRFTNDRCYLESNYPKVIKLLDAYRREYERNGLLRAFDKWCVVEWPANFRHDYDVDLTEGQVCHQAHVSINAYYLKAIRTANTIAAILNQPPYREEAPLLERFYHAFYDPARALFKDGEQTDHVSLVGNSFVYGLGLCPNNTCKQAILDLYDRHGLHTLSFFCTFPMLWGFVRDGDEQRLLTAILNEGTWKRMLREDATSTFEGWGKDTKKNTSLFHLTMSYAALFLADTDHKYLLG